MGPSTSSVFQYNPQRNETEVQCISMEDSLSQLIGYAGGVSYQLIFGMNRGDGIYRFVNKGANSFFGITGNELKEMLFVQMIDEIIPEDENMPDNRFEVQKKFLSGEIETWRAEILISNVKGEKKWIRDISIPIKDDKTGKVMGIAGIFFDITGQKNIVVQLEKAREKATESDRLKSALLNNLSHEIRTPLNAIVGFTTLFGEPGTDDADRIEYIDIITRSSDHLLEIVDNIVEISKIEAKIVRSNLKETNLNEILERVLDNFIASAKEKNIGLSCKIPEESQTIILTDGYKVFQSLSNLVDNAIKFTRTGMVEFGMIRSTGRINFYVTDTGIGIGLEHQHNIFSPFYQAEIGSTHRYDGTGLGLAIAKGYIELIGGEIWFSSQPGIGSKFYFNIPDRKFF